MADLKDGKVMLEKKIHREKKSAFAFSLRQRKLFKKREKNM